MKVYLYLCFVGMYLCNRCCRILWLLIALLIKSIKNFFKRINNNICWIYKRTGKALQIFPSPIIIFYYYVCNAFCLAALETLLLLYFLLLLLLLLILM